MKRCGSLLGKSQVIFVVLPVIDLTAVFICKVLVSPACTGCPQSGPPLPLQVVGLEASVPSCSPSRILARPAHGPCTRFPARHGPCTRFPALHRGPALSLSPAVDEVQETLHLEHDAWNCFLRLTLARDSDCGAVLPPLPVGLQQRTPLPPPRPHSGPPWLTSSPPPRPLSCRLLCWEPRPSSVPCPPSGVRIFPLQEASRASLLLHPCPMSPMASNPVSPRPKPQGTRSTRRVLPLPSGAACRMVSGVLQDGCVGTMVTAVLCSGQGPAQAWLCCVGSCGAHDLPSALSAGAPAALELGIIPVSWGVLDCVAELCHAQQELPPQKQGRVLGSALPGPRAPRLPHCRKGRPPTHQQGR